MQDVMSLPHNREAETAVIGSLLINPNPDAADKVFRLLKPESFYLFAHNKIFEQLKALYAENQPLDLISLDERLNAKGIGEELGGFAYLVDLAKNTPSSANLVTYAEIVRDCAMKRFAIAKLNECEKLLFSKSDQPAEKLLNDASHLFSQISDYAKEGKTGGLVTATDIGLEWLDDQEARANSPELVKGLSTGIDALDELLAPKGLIKGSLLMVGARPKVGKTTFYAQLALQCVRVEKKRALLFSLEMGRKQIFERMIGQVAGINTNVFYYTDKPFYHDEHYARAHNAIAEITQENLLMIDDTPAVSMAYIRSECRRIQREQGEIGLVGVDYLTLMTAEKAERNDLAYGQIVKEMKNLARELNCVVMLLTQLNRGLENRTDKRPVPSDSRDTGQVEQECDYWIGLHREANYREDADPYLIEIIVRSNRHGAGGTVYADFRNGSIYQVDQQQAKARAEQGKPVKRQAKKEF
ncbi:MAG: DnaB-like helicase C-terminal domain-containing protein [Pasteurellaceae bacterium]|nr:DnaB-like helicase C-terminal domain-containing protein [Pasteurellaceae bacterium]